MNNLEMLNQRLNYQGGNQEGRMIKDKYKSFLSSLGNSYQTADIKSLNRECAPIHKALINPDKTKMDYDNKILSVDYKYNYKTGDIFHWVNTDTYWLIYLRELTEDAYFRAEIRRCKYKLQWIDEDTKEKHEVYAYIRGPVETKVNFIQKAGISVDVPNESLVIYVPASEENLLYFQRYARFMLNGKAWEVQSVDSISTEGILQIAALEHYINATLDDEENNLVNAFEVVYVKEEDDSDIIRGSDVMIPTTIETYTIEGVSSVVWSVENPKSPVLLTPIGDSSVEVFWEPMISGNFTLIAEAEGQVYKKNITVESLF